MVSIRHNYMLRKRHHLPISSEMSSLDVPTRVATILPKWWNKAMSSELVDVSREQLAVLHGVCGRTHGEGVAERCAPRTLSHSTPPVTLAGLRTAQMFVCRRTHQGTTRHATTACCRTLKIIYIN